MSPCCATATAAEQGGVKRHARYLAIISIDKMAAGGSQLNMSRMQSLEFQSGELPSTAELGAAAVEVGRLRESVVGVGHRGEEPLPPIAPPPPDATAVLHPAAAPSPFPAALLAPGD